MNTFEMDNLSGRNHEGARPNSPVQFLTATSIIGDKVVNLQDEYLGSINDIMIDIAFARIEYVVIELGGFMGIGTKFFAVPFAILKLDPKNKRFILDQSKKILDKAPGFDKEHWPETNTHTLVSSTVYWNGVM